MSLSQDTLEKLREKYAELQMQQALAQQQQSYTSTQAHINAHQQALGAYTTTTTSPSWTTLGMQSSPIPIEVQQHNLNEGAWDVPISQLVDLWVVKYGTKWVNHNELDEFYEVASRRLKALNKLEQHYVNGTDVYRIVE